MRFLRRLFVLTLVALVANLSPAYAGTRPEGRADICNLRCRWYRAVIANRAAAVALLERTREEDALANAGNCLAVLAVASRWFPRDQLGNVGRVIHHESSWEFYEGRCNPGALNPNGMDSGLFQLRLPLHADLFYAIPYCQDWQRARFDAVCNTHAAANLFNGAGGWYPHWRGAL